MTQRALTLVETTRTVEPDMAELKEGRRFLDYAIDGDALYPQMLRRGFDTITPLWLDGPTSHAIESIERLLGARPGDAPYGRVSVYVCAECGDLGCGAVTVRLIVSVKSVEWREWGRQNNYEDDVSYADFHATGSGQRG